MVRKRWMMALLAIGLAAVFIGTAVAAGTENVPRITKEDLKNMIGKPGLVLIDVRQGKDWDSSEFKIQGAERKEPGQFDSWKMQLPKDQTIVLYCAWNNEGTSASLAQKLIENGYTKVYALKGGWREWQRDKFPTVQK